jgi:hypothetical protein
MPYMPPQNLTAEAVAALPPPGKLYRSSTWTSLFRASLNDFSIVKPPKRLVGSVCYRIQPEGYIQWQIQILGVRLNYHKTEFLVEQPAAPNVGRGFGSRRCGIKQ